MNQRLSHDRIDHLDKSARFQHYASMPHNEKRHYWGVPNTNFGFYTSDQLEAIQRTRRGQTEPRERQTESRERQTESRERQHQWREDSQGRFIVEKDKNGYVHCCSCHNNPKRYISSQQRCNYCLEYQKSRSQEQLGHGSVLSRLTNPEIGAESPLKKVKTVEDKQIQVELKLPSIVKHRSKKYKDCQACKDKLATMQGCKVKVRTEGNQANRKYEDYGCKRRLEGYESKGRYLAPLDEVEEAGGDGRDSLIYSFSAKKRRL